MDSLERIKKLTDKYLKFTNESACISISVWKHKGRGKFDIEMHLSYVDQYMKCEQNKFESLDEIEEFIKLRIAERNWEQMRRVQKSILFRRFK